jgi:hypothetical protein
MLIPEQVQSRLDAGCGCGFAHAESRSLDC